jgi:hypothetical protein
LGIAHGQADAGRGTRQSRRGRPEELGSARADGKLQAGLSSVETTGAEKYEDFEAKISEAVEARGGEPLHPMLSIGIAVSPAGADIAYRLASDESIAEKIEKLATTNPQQAAVAFGELEGEYVDDDADLNLADPLDRAAPSRHPAPRLRNPNSSEVRIMSNAFKNTTKVANRLLLILKNQMVMAKLVDSRFKTDFPGASGNGEVPIGDTITIRRRRCSPSPTARPSPRRTSWSAPLSSPSTSRSMSASRSPTSSAC